jgi:hypothetical protein
MGETRNMLRIVAGNLGERNDLRVDGRTILKCI